MSTRLMLVKTKNGSFPADEQSVCKQVTYQGYKWPACDGEKIISVEYQPDDNDTDQNTIAFECRHQSNIRFSLRTRENEDIASTISRLFRIPTKRLKLVAKGKLIAHSDAASYAQEGVPIFFVGSPVTEEQIAVRKQKKKEKALREIEKKAKLEEEKKKAEQKRKQEEEWIKAEMKKVQEEKKKVAEKQKKKEKGKCKMVMKFFTSFSSTRVMRIARSAAQFSTLFVTSFFSPVEGIGQEPTEQERPQQPRFRTEQLPTERFEPDRERKRPIGRVGGGGKTQKHGVPMGMGMGGG